MEGWEFFKRAGTLVGLSSAVVGLAWFCFTTVSRISRLESQMQALVIVKPSDGGYDVPAPEPEKSSLAETEVSPLNLVCADLASKLYNKYKDKGAIPVLEPALAVMDQLGCKKVGRGQ